MGAYRSRVRLSLTQAEAEALIVMVTEAIAGDLDALFENPDIDGRRVAARIAAAVRADEKLRHAYQQATDRDQAKEAQR